MGEHDPERLVKVETKLDMLIDATAEIKALFNNYVPKELFNTVEQRLKKVEQKMEQASHKWLNNAVSVVLALCAIGSLITTIIVVTKH